jgi:hypothetical protein
MVIENDARRFIIEAL